MKYFLCLVPYIVMYFSGVFITSSFDTTTWIEPYKAFAVMIASAASLVISIGVKTKAI